VRTLTAIGVDAERCLRGAADALRTSGGAGPGNPRDPLLQPYQRHDGAAQALPMLLAARVTRIDLQLSIISDAAARAIAQRA
jgi:hypothetical protein